jgi:hypothetical protein
MSTREMKALLAELGKEAAKSIERPAEPKIVMHEFCRAMGVRRSRPVQLVFRTFPPDIPVSGMRLNCGDRSIVVVEQNTHPESQLVILGHELWHEVQDDGGHHIPGVTASARALSPDHAQEVVREAAKQVLAAAEVPREAFRAVAARANSAEDHEVDAETFGLLFGREVRTWMKGRYAEGPVSPATVEGRINLSLSNRTGIL